MSLLLLLLLAGRVETEVVVFVLPGCPLARLYAERLNSLALEYPLVRFRAVDCSPEQGSADAVALPERLVFPLVAVRKLIAKLGATRSPEVFLLTGGRVVYSGRYDFRWQHRYVLAVPRQLPRVTTLRVTAVFDNTTENPNNPAPTATVRAGRQTTDAMFQACEVVRTHENRLAQRNLRAWIPVLAALTAILWIVRLGAGSVNLSSSRRD
jgi:hypothetical protein